MAWQFFDTHNHLDYLALDTHTQAETLVENARAMGVARQLVVAVKAADFARVEQLAEACPETIRFGLGLHPLFIQEHHEADLTLLEQKLSARSPRCTAVAEIGLERHVEALLTPELWQKQLDFLNAQLALAKRYQLAVSLHSRKSHDQLFPLLKRANLSKTGVVHGFSGSYTQAKRFVDLGFKIGVGGTITYPRAQKTRETIRQLPLEALVLETDSPDMPVLGFQGEPNRPERIQITFNALCELRTESPEQIAQTAWENSVALFEA